MSQTSVNPLNQYTVLNAVQLGLIELPADADTLSVARAMAEHSVHCIIVRGIEGDGWGIVTDQLAALAEEAVPAAA